MNPTPIEVQILEQFPIPPPFRFVDRIISLDDDSILGEFTFSPDSFFYPAHFPGRPITPGSILSECCAQIALLAFGLSAYIQGGLEDPTQSSGSGGSPDLNSSASSSPLEFALVRSRMEYLLPVLPGTRVEVSGQKQLFRFGRLKMNVQMKNHRQRLICSGTMEGQLRITAGWQ